MGGMKEAALALRVPLAWPLVFSSMAIGAIVAAFLSTWSAVVIFLSDGEKENVFVLIKEEGMENAWSVEEGYVGKVSRKILPTLALSSRNVHSSPCCRRLQLYLEA